MIDGEVHEPWVGDHYGKNSLGRRIAICGYSHTDADEKNSTIDCIQKVISGKYYNISFFNRIRDYFGFKSHYDFWHKIVFFNFVPTSVGPRSDKYARASKEQEVLGQKRVLEILNKHEPNILFVFTTKGWEAFPSTPEDGLIPRGSKLYDMAIYRMHDGHPVRAVGFRHPQGARIIETAEAVSEVLSLPVLEPRPSATGAKIT